MKRLTAMAVVLFALVVLLGPLYTADGYNSVSNLISELGAQETKNNYIMISGFILLGSGIIIASMKKLSYPIVPFMLFGLFMITAGIFPHKPIDTTLQYNAAFHGLHGASATFAGISITSGFIWQGVLTRDKASRILCFYLATICFAFPMLMLAVPAFQGLIQRTMYLQVLGWMMVMHPDRIMANKSR